MNTIASLLALACLAAPTPAHAQTVTAEGGVVLRTKRSVGPRQDGVEEPSPFPRREFIGEHTLAPAQPGRSRVVFVLHRWRDDDGGADTVASIGRRDFVDDFLLSRLEEQKAEGISGIAVVDRVVSRSTDASQAVEFERAIEFEGPDGLVERSLDYLHRFVERNREMFDLELVCAMRRPDDDTRGAGGGDGSARVSVLDSVGHDRLRELLATREDTTILSSPRITVYGAQRGTIQLTNQTSYVADFELVATEGVLLADPVVKTFNDGLLWFATVIVDPEDDSLVINTSARFTALQKPMRTFKTQIAPNVKPVTFQLPEWDEATWTGRTIHLGKNETGIHVAGLRLTTWNEDGEPRIDEIELLIGIRRRNEAVPPAVADLGVVLGVDASTGKVFLRRNVADTSFEMLADRLRIVRDGAPVGECTLIEQLNGVLVLRLEQGEARAGDSVKK